MLRLAALALIFGPSLAAQPVVPQAEGATHLLSAWGEPALPVSQSEWEAPPALYWTGVGLDVAALAGGTYILVQSVRALRAIDGSEPDPTLGIGPMLVVVLGTAGAVLGGGAVAVSTYDLARVAGGDDPWLARLFDPARPPGWIPVPIPDRPPGLPPVR